MIVRPNLADEVGAALRAPLFRQRAPRRREVEGHVVKNSSRTVRPWRIHGCAVMSSASRPDAWKLPTLWPSSALTSASTVHPHTGGARNTCQTAECASDRARAGLTCAVDFATPAPAAAPQLDRGARALFPWGASGSWSFRGWACDEGSAPTRSRDTMPNENESSIPLLQARPYRDMARRLAENSLLRRTSVASSTIRRGTATRRARGIRPTRRRSSRYATASGRSASLSASAPSARVDLHLGHDGPVADGAAPPARSKRLSRRRNARRGRSAI